MLYHIRNFANIVKSLWEERRWSFMGHERNFITIKSTWRNYLILVRVLDFVLHFFSPRAEKSEFREFRTKFRKFRVNLHVQTWPKTDWNHQKKFKILGEISDEISFAQNYKTLFLAAKKKRSTDTIYIAVIYPYKSITFNIS